MVRYPDFMDTLVPMASQPTEMSGRNWMLRKRHVRAVTNSLDKRQRTRQAHRAAARRDQSEAGVDGRRCFATFQGNSSSMRLAW